MFIAICVLVIFFLIFIFISGNDKKIEWGELPQSGYIKDRFATLEDMDKSSVFVLEGAPGHSLNKDIEIPQFAYHNDKKWYGTNKVPCIIVQAEMFNDSTVIGYIEIKSGKKGAGLSMEFELLGKEPPPNASR